MRNGLRFKTVAGKCWEFNSISAFLIEYWSDDCQLPFNEERLMCDEFILNGKVIKAETVGTMVTILSKKYWSKKAADYSKNKIS